MKKKRFSKTMTRPLIPNKIPPKSMSLRQLLNLDIPKYDTAGLPNKNVAKRLNRKRLEGLMERMKFFRVICFFISKFHDMTILMTIDTAFPKKKDPVPRFKQWIKKKLSTTQTAVGMIEIYLQFLNSLPALAKRKASIMPLIPRKDNKTVYICRALTESASTHFSPQSRPKNGSEKLYPKVSDRHENKVIDFTSRISVLTDYFQSPRVKQLYTTYYRGANKQRTTIEPKLEIRTQIEEKEDTSRVTRAIFQNCWMPSFSTERVRNSLVDSCVFLSTKYVYAGLQSSLILTLLKFLYSPSLLQQLMTNSKKAQMSCPSPNTKIPHFSNSPNCAATNTNNVFGKNEHISIIALLMQLYPSTFLTQSQQITSRCISKTTPTKLPPFRNTRSRNPNSITSFQVRSFCNDTARIRKLSRKSRLPRLYRNLANSSLNVCSFRSSQGLKPFGRPV